MFLLQKYKKTSNAIAELFNFINTLKIKSLRITYHHYDFGLRQALTF